MLQDQGATEQGQVGNTTVQSSCEAKAHYKWVNTTVQSSCEAEA